MFSLNHTAIGTRYSGSASIEAKEAFYEAEEMGWPELEEWKKSAKEGDRFQVGGGVYVELTWS